MAKVYLQNNDVHDDVLEYDTETGQGSRHRRKELPLGKKTDRGFFADVDGKIYGVFASPTGPVFFHGDSRHPLEKGAFTVSLRRGSKSHRFSLSRGDDEIVSVWYRAPQAAGTTPYDEDEAFVDFFAWVEANIDSDRFYEWHTFEARKKKRSFGEYLWVRNNSTGKFEERYRVIKLGEDEDELPDRGDVDGVVPGPDANAAFEKLRERFPAPGYECGRTYATDWHTVETQAIPLRDYDYD